LAIFTAMRVLATVFAVLLVVSGIGKLMKAEFQMDSLRKVGFPENRVVLLAIAEVAGAVGLLAGLVYWPIAIAAAIGLILYFAGAVIAHIRVRDWNFGAAAMLLVFAVAALVLRLVTANQP
jgi:uncharacterized membrane protein YphA (DoxX/SURF4 family)